MFLAIHVILRTDYLMLEMHLELVTTSSVHRMPPVPPLLLSTGLDFMSVLTRGSQYRVESMLSRLARSQGYVIPSPDKSQVASQPALQCLPLVMEPEGRFYTSPVVVSEHSS